MRKIRTISDFICTRSVLYLRVHRTKSVLYPRVHRAYIGLNPYYIAAYIRTISDFLAFLKPHQLQHQHSANARSRRTWPGTMRGRERVPDWPRRTGVCTGNTCNGVSTRQKN